MEVQYIYILKCNIFQLKIIPTVKNLKAFDYLNYIILFIHILFSILRLHDFKTFCQQACLFPIGLFIFHITFWQTFTTTQGLSIERSVKVGDFQGNPTRIYSHSE